MVDASPLIMFHKPRGVVVTRADELGRKTLYDLLPAWIHDAGWQPVGRLDLDSRGLIFLTRDGRLNDRLTRPGACCKLYEVTLRGHLQPEHLAAIERGVDSPVGRLSARRVAILRYVGHKTLIEAELDEGKNRHLRRLFGAFKDPRKGTALKVLELKRVMIGEVRLDVPPGAWRFLSEAESSPFLIKNHRR